MQSDPNIRRTALLMALLASLAGGCSSVKMTGSSRSGTEQLLLTGAWDAALCQVDFRPLAGSKVFLDDKHVTVVDKDWVISSIRRSMARQGVLLENKEDKAQVIVEASVGAYGTDDRSCAVGLPQMGFTPSLLGIGGGASSGSSSSSSSSSMNFSQTNKQDAVVKAALFAYEAKSGQLIWDSGPVFNNDGYRDHLLLGTGPVRLSSNRDVEDYPYDTQAKVRRRPWRSLLP